MPTPTDLAAALQRVQSVFERRPEVAQGDDSPAHATWRGGLQVQVQHDNGALFSTDMPAEMGGSGRHVSPGWLFRAGLASCASTSIAMLAASQGITLMRLAVRACSQSDSRGLFGMAGDDGQPVRAEPQALQLHITLAAHGVAPAQLQALVEEALRRSPIPSAVQRANLLTTHIDVATH